MGCTRRRAPVLTLLLLCLVAASCTSARDAPRDEAAPTPSGAVLDTVERVAVGDRLTITAAVVRVLAPRAFVVSDVDLPDRGLLVLGDGPAGLSRNDLVTVSGTVDRFAFDRFRFPYDLADAGAYGSFEGRKVLVASAVRSWA
jgi:hypothetical protein